MALSSDERPKSFWIFDVNRRRYPQGGRISDSPIWIEQWREAPVTGETRVSWIIGTSGGWDERKIPKRGPWPRRDIARSREEVEALGWAEETRTEIYRRAHSFSGLDFAEVVRFARALGIEVPPVVEGLCAAAASAAREGEAGRGTRRPGSPNRRRKES